MRRRELLLSLATGMMGARAVRAQQKVVPVIGYLSSVSANRTEPLLATFRQGLGENGYVEGQNVALEYRWADGHYDRLPALAANLVGRKVDVIATSGGDPSALAAKARPRQSRSFPWSGQTQSQADWLAASRGRAAI